MKTETDEIATRRKKIAMVHPVFPPSFWSFGYIKDIGGFKTVMPPLGLATLAALGGRQQPTGRLALLVVPPALAGLVQIAPGAAGKALETPCR